MAFDSSKFFLAPVLLYCCTILSEHALRRYNNLLCDRVLLDSLFVNCGFKYLIAMQFHHVKSTFATDLKNVVCCLYNVFILRTISRNCRYMMHFVRNRSCEKFPICSPFVQRHLQLFMERQQLSCKICCLTLHRRFSGSRSIYFKSTNVWYKIIFGKCSILC